MRAIFYYLFSLFSMLLANSGAFALGGQDIRPEDVIHWEAVSGTISTATKTSAAGNHIVIGLRLRTEQDFTIYQHNLTISGPAGYPVFDIKAPDTKRQLDPISGEEVDVYQGGDFEITFDGPEIWKGDQFPIAIKYVGCTQVICLFPHTDELMVKVYQEDPLAALPPNSPDADADTPAFREPSASVEAVTPVSKEDCASKVMASSNTDGDNLQSRLAKMLNMGGFSLGMLLLVVFAGGVLSNLTPCVYPMIPITVRLLGRQGHSHYFGSSFYALGIVLTYSALGLIAALSGGLFGSIMASTWFNLVFATVMILLGVSMLGFGNFSALQNIGNRLGAGKPNAKNYFLMGAGAGLVAAPCTGPILAALLAYTAKNQNVTQSISLMLSYSVGFALPYLILGGAATRASKVKIPPQAQVAVKLIFAAVMFALGLYYLRVPLYSLTLSMKDHWSQLASVGLTFGAALVALCVYLPKLAASKTAQIGPALILGLGLFGLSQKLTAVGINEACLKASWHKTEESALAAAKASGKPILIDMWAEWCEACKKMDATTFQDPRVQDLLAAGWILLKLDLTESNAANDSIQERYELTGLPTLVLLPSDGSLANKNALTGYQPASDLLTELGAFAKKGP